MAFKCFFNHTWDHCKCTRCGAIMPPSSHGSVPHVWDGCTCRICGTKRDEGHQYKNAVCVKCGKKLLKSELLKLFKYDMCKPLTRLDLNNLDPKEQLENAYNNFPPKDADEILIELCDTVQRICNRERCILDEMMDRFIVPFVNESNLLKLYQNHVNMPALTKHLDEDIVLRSCSDMDKNEKRKFLIKCDIADGETVTLCDLGKHDFECIETGWQEPSLTADTEGHSYKYRILKCKRCGKKEKVV